VEAWTREGEEAARPRGRRDLTRRFLFAQSPPHAAAAAASPGRLPTSRAPSQKSEPPKGCDASRIKQGLLFTCGDHPTPPPQTPRASLPTSATT
jgi:hypothetical protein